VISGKAGSNFRSDKTLGLSSPLFSTRAVGMLLFLLLLFLMGVRLLRRTRRHGTGGRWHNGHDTPSLAASCVVRSQPKPPWVRAELIRLKAWSPDLGCRVIAEIFNRQFAERRVSVGKTYVAGILRRSKSDIAYLRRTIKHRIPRPLARNRTWALDLTGKTDLTGRQHMLLGLLDHGTRPAWNSQCCRTSAVSRS